MACFLVPAGEGVVTEIVKKIESKKEKKLEVPAQDIGKIPFSRKLGWLSKLLWGGSALLAFEHVWHGEVVPYFPFLTAMDFACHPYPSESTNLSPPTYIHTCPLLSF